MMRFKHAGGQLVSLSFVWGVISALFEGAVQSDVTASRVYFLANYVPSNANVSEEVFSEC